MENRKYINLFSKKIKITGLTNNAENLIGKWYNLQTFKNGHVTLFDKIKGKSIFLKMLKKTDLFQNKLNIEIIESDKWGFSFKCKDKNDIDLLVSFFIGSTIEQAPRLIIVNKDNIKNYYIGFPSDGIGGKSIPCIQKQIEESINIKDNQNRLNNYNSVFNMKNDEKIEIKNNKIKNDEKIEIKNDKTNNNVTKEFVDKYFINNEEFKEECKSLKK